MVEIRKAFVGKLTVGSAKWLLVFAIMIGVLGPVWMRICVFLTGTLAMLLWIRFAIGRVGIVAAVVVSYVVAVRLVMCVLTCACCVGGCFVVFVAWPCVMVLCIL